MMCLGTVGSHHQTRVWTRWFALPMIRAASLSRLVVVRSPPTPPPQRRRRRPSSSPVPAPSVASCPRKPILPPQGRREPGLEGRPPVREGSVRADENAQKLLCKIRQHVHEDTNPLVDFPEFCWLAHCMARCPGGIDVRGEMDPLTTFSELAKLMLQWRQQQASVMDIRNAMREIRHRAFEDVQRSRREWLHHRDASGCDFWHCPARHESTWDDPALPLEFFGHVAERLLQALPAVQAPDAQNARVCDQAPPACPVRDAPAKPNLMRMFSRDREESPSILTVEDAPTRGPRTPPKTRGVRPRPVGCGFPEPLSAQAREFQTRGLATGGLSPHLASLGGA